MENILFLKWTNKYDQINMNTAEILNLLVCVNVLWKMSETHDKY